MSLSIKALFRVVLMAFASTAFATSYAPPTDREIKSSNGKYILRISAKDSMHYVFEKSSPKKVLWSFSRHLWHDDYYLSDDGARVVWVAWPYVQVSETSKSAIEVWTKDGLKEAATFDKVGDLRKPSKGEIAPIGDFWRVWRAASFYEHGQVTVVQSHKITVNIDLKTGKISRGG